MDDLLHDFPRDYEKYDSPVEPGKVTAGARFTVAGHLMGRPSVRFFNGRSITMARLREDNGALQINWFNMPYLKSTLKDGEEYYLRGTVTERKGRLVMEHPEVYTVQAYEKVAGRILPVYRLTKGLTNRTVRKAVRAVLDMKPLFADPLPDEVRTSYGLADINFALAEIHFPDSEESLIAARSRLAFDDFFFFLLGIEMSRSLLDTRRSVPMRTVWKTEDVIDSLPYRLTSDQKKAWTDIERDMASERPMMRMIQGDVGSGKTILAFLAMIMADENGHQSALMAPTEVLADQHFHSLESLLEKNGIDTGKLLLLTGNLTAAEKKKAHESIKDGEKTMIIGTHALFQEKAEYQDIGLVITDEQHRFGVLQRRTFSDKGDSPNVLVMSATPIPRTLMMTLYGDMDVSVIRQVPSDRLPVKNCVVGPAYRKSAYRFIKKQVEAGHQAYIICPMVEPNEDLPLANVREYSQTMKKVFGGGVRVEALHGQMKGGRKREIMESFAAGDIDVLVSTTVVEVGVDVPNATVMMIENAERFGLAQLHQLRGRVGRGRDQSYCIFIQADGRKKSERLSVLEHSNDGFLIAGEDLKLRGPGDLFGIRQSGEALFGIADIYRDRDMLELAGRAVRDLLSYDSDLSLPQNSGLKKKLLEYMEKSRPASD